MRYRISRRDPPAPVWSATPAPSFTQGVSASYSLSSISSDPGSQPLTYSSVGAALPSGVTINNTTKALDFSGTGTPATTSGLRLRASNGANSSDSALFSLTIAASSAVVDVTTFQVTSPTGGLDLPWTFGHAFKQGDVPTGTYLVANQANFSADPQTYWPDGSVKHAIISGRNTLVGGVASTITLRRTGVNPAAPGPGLAALQSNMPTVTIAGGAHTTTLNNLLGTPFRVVSTSEQMSNWIFREAVSGSPLLTVWVDVRYYAGGAIEIFPWVENGYVQDTTTAHDTRTWTVTIAGVSRFSQSVTAISRARAVLATGSTFSYWVGTDPQIVPKHNRTYLTATKLVPNYGWTTPSESRLTSLQQTYAPLTATYTRNTTAQMDGPQGNPGGAGALIGAQDGSAPSLYISSGGDARAYRAMVVFGLASGAWPVHFRDSSNNEIPKFSSFPDIWQDSPGSGSPAWVNPPAVPLSYTTDSFGPTVSHQPSYGYLPWLVTGRWFFFEEQAFWTFWNYTKARVRSRRGESSYETGPFMFSSGSAGVIDPNMGTYACRGAHWAIRTLAQTLATCPTSHPIYADLLAAWENNTQFYKAKYVDGTHSPGWVSPYGVLGDYSSGGGSLYPPTNPDNNWWGGAWYNNYGIQVWGFASDIGLPQSAASQTRHETVRNHAYKFVVLRSGDGANGTWSWRRFTVYGYPYGTDAVGMPWETWFTSAQSYSAMLAGYGLANIPSTLGLPLKAHSSDVDANQRQTYFETALSALAYAVDHGAPGAADGWMRIAGGGTASTPAASNYALLTSYLNDTPEHGVAPRVTPSALPSWVSSLAVNQWTELANTKLSDQPGMDGLPASPGKQDAWCGWHVDTRSSKVYSVGQGGHGDYYGNEVNVLTLNTATPAWSQLVAASSAGNVTFNSNYYLDGKPCSVHGYHTSVFINSLDRALRFPGGARSISGSGTNQIIAFNILTGAYDSEATWNGTAISAGPGSNAYAKHPTTEVVYGWFYNSLFARWNPGVPGSWTTLISSPPNPAPAYTAGACDPTRGTAGQCFFIGGGDPAPIRRRYDIGAATFQDITLTGTSLPSFRGCAVEYVAALDRYIVCTSSSGGSAVYSIAPNSTTTWPCTLLATTGGSTIPETDSNSAFYPFTKFLYLPALGGCIFGPRWTYNCWFLKLHNV